MNTEAPLVTQMTINEIIHEYPATVEVFNRVGIDACCGGAATIAEAAARDGVDPAFLLDALLDALRAPR